MNDEMDNLLINGFVRSMMIAFLSSFATPIIFSILEGFSRHGGFTDFLVLFMASSFFSIIFTCSIAACALLVLRLLKIYNYDGYAAIGTVALIALIAGINEDGSPSSGVFWLWVGMPNAIAFFIMHRYFPSFFDKLASD